LFSIGDLATIKSMNKLALRFGLPADLETLIDTGVLEISRADDATKTLRLVVPSLRQKDRKGRIKIVTITWIHPDYNAQFCHYYHLAPGDLPNFYVALRCSRRKRCARGLRAPHAVPIAIGTTIVSGHMPQCRSCDRIGNTIA
jgi:hypothetical protein